MRRYLATAITATLIASSACALVFTPPTTALEGAPAGTYVLDKSHANVIFNISHMGFSHYFGRFNALDATITFDPKTPENSKVTATVDVTSIDTNNAKLEEELKDVKWFDTKKYPTATFTSTKLEKLSASNGKLYGDLTLHGVTQPIVLDVTFNGTGMNTFMNTQELGFSAATTIKRSDFGISEYIPMVGDEVMLTIETEFFYKK